MKKLFVLPMILFLAASVCFAQDDEVVKESKSEVPVIEKFDLEIYAGFPVHWSNAKHGQDFYMFNPGYNMEDKSVTANTAIGVSMIFNINKKVGFNIDTDFFYGAKLAGFANPTSDYISMFGANVLLGPVFYLYNGDFLRIPLTVGGHLYYFSDDLWMPTSLQATDGLWANRKDLQVGPGFSLGIQFHFSENIYIFSRTNVVMDLFRWHQINYIADDGTGSGTNTDYSKSEIEFVIGWGVKPVIGLGIKF